MANYGEKSRRRAWLTIWDKVKSRGTFTDWCTGRERSVNCMTVISAWWRSNMQFQGRWKWHIPMASYKEILSGRLNYNIIRWWQEVSQFGDREFLETRCSRESQHTAEWAPGLPVEHQENGKEILMAIRVGVNMLQFCSVSDSLSHMTLFNKVRGIFFKEDFARLYYCVNMYSRCICVYMHIYYVAIQQRVFRCSCDI